MQKLGYLVRERWGYLLATALFWLLAFLALPGEAAASSAGWPAFCAFGVALALCSFVAVLLLGDSLVKNFLVIALLVGTFLVVARPFAWPMDEEYHFLRAFDLTNGRVLPADAGGWLPEGYEVFAERGRWTVLTVFDAPELWFSQAGPLSFVERVRSASYLPLAYLPAAAGIGLARLLRLPLVLIVVFGRLANYLFYVGVCALAISRTKTLRSLLFLAAASTGAFSLCGTIAIDLPLIACSLLYVSICLHYCFDDGAGARIAPRDIALLALSAAMVMSVKYCGYFLILPLFLFVSSKRYCNKNRTALVISAAALLIAGVQLAAVLRYRGSLTGGGPAGTDAAAQLGYILENPIGFAKTLTGNMLWYCYERLLQQHELDCDFLAIISMFGALLPMLGALLAPDKPGLERRARIRWSAFALGASTVMQAICCVALYVSFNPVGADKIVGVQERYTLPFLILVMLAASMPRVKNEMRNWTRLIGFLSLLTVANAAVGMLLQA